MLHLDGNTLTVDSVQRVAVLREKVGLSKRSLERMDSYRRKLELKMNVNEKIYGANTGFGSLSNKAIDKDDARKLQLNLIRSHSAGVGPPFSIEVVRAAMVAKLNALLKGNSCVRPCVAILLSDMLNSDVVPLVPSIGSLGASGDLAPSAHMALALVAEGKSYYRGKLMNSKEALKKAGIKPIILEAKEGLSLINGTCFTVALGCQAIARGRKLLEIANSCVTLTSEVMQACEQSFDEGLMELRNHVGQVLMAKDIRVKLRKSKRLRSSPVPQDPYSIRCVPQVHGSTYDAIAFAEALINTELNSVTDNPVMTEDGMIVHGGNFHAQPVAMILDLLSLAVSYLGDMSLSRIHQLMRRSSAGNGFFARKPGLESGLMITEYTATALMNENSHLIHPSSSYPADVSGGVEDHASHGVNAGMKAMSVTANVSKILAIELMCGSNAVELMKLSGLSPHSTQMLNLVRKYSPTLSGDRPVGEDIEVLSAKLLEPYDHHNERVPRPRA